MCGFFHESFLQKQPFTMKFHHCTCFASLHFKASPGLSMRQNCRGHSRSEQPNNSILRHALIFSNISPKHAVIGNVLGLYLNRAYTVCCRLTGSHSAEIRIKMRHRWKYNIWPTLFFVKYRFCRHIGGDWSWVGGG